MNDDDDGGRALLELGRERLCIEASLFNGGALY